MKPIEPGPYEVSLDGKTCVGRVVETDRGLVFYGIESLGEILKLREINAFWHDATFTPLIPAPQWMPEGWVPSEPGAYWAYHIETNGVRQICEVIKYGESMDGRFMNDYEIGQSEFKEYRWCPLPAAPKMGE